jgi:hypothetical protein
MPPEMSAQPALADDSSAPNSSLLLEMRAFVDEAFHELSQPVTAAWCALELATLRPPDAEEDRQDLLAAFAMMEQLGNKLRRMQSTFAAQFQNVAVGERVRKT